MTPSLKKAEQILGYPINVISGEEEAATIYKGVAHTSDGCGRRLVVDIGGASTELIIGEGFTPKALTSLKMGCVTWLEQFFKDRQLNKANFERAIEGAKQALTPVLQRYQDLGWDVCVGASGTVQALQEIMLAQGMDEVITLPKLKRLQAQAMQADQLEELDIAGLTLERALVFPSGLSILIAIFELLNIDSMTLAGGALREGMVYDMVKKADLQHDNIRSRTIDSVQQRYQLDVAYGEQVALAANKLALACGGNTWFEDSASALLESAAKLHEIGLTLDFKNAGEHGAYLLENLNLPGFTRAQKQLLAEVVRRYKDQLTPLPIQHAVSGQSAQRVLRLLRLAIIITHRRQHQLQPSYTINCDTNAITLSIDKQWLADNPLSAAELELESHRQSDLNWPLTIQAI